MIFHPRDRRRIREALRASGDEPSLQTWNEWAKMFMVNQPSAPAPYQIAAIALRAVETDEQELTRRLASEPDEDAWADIENDLGYVQAIKAALLAENVGH